MTKLIDLSHEISDAMTVHPYDGSVSLYQDRFLETDGYNNFRLETGMHAGTHIDVPMHLTGDKTFISEVPAERFSGRGCLINVGSEEVVSFRREYDNIVNEHDIVLIYTGHSSFFGTEEYYTSHPVISEELTDFFIERNIKMLGIDLPSPDREPFNIHKKLFHNNILLLENLTNLSGLLHVHKFEVFAFPLKIRAEASLCRVVARTEKD